MVLSELLPRSSSSKTDNHIPIYNFDVFLSFRGVDTRYSFIDHLYNSLVSAGYKTFLDDEEIEPGEPLKPELESGIKSSRASIIVLSKNYASSTWCLEELVLILEQKTNFDQIVIPIFYDVEPTTVRHQESSFADALAKHEQWMKEEANAEKKSQRVQKMELWKRALTTVADLKGKVAKGRKETEFIEEVVTEIQSRLGLPLSNTQPTLIGRHYDYHYLSSWLTDGSCHTTDILTVVGIGGIGKTSLAKHVFQLHYNKFYRSSFIEGVNAKCNECGNGLASLQKQLQGVISIKKSLQANDVSKKVFIVLDDIGNLKQLDALLGNKGLHPGSKIIVTTKNASLIKSCALSRSQVNLNYKEVILNGLDSYDSLELLCIHAFNSHVPIEGYEDVSKELVTYCEGHPLALKVSGGSLHNRDVPYWKDYIELLKTELRSSSSSSIYMALKMSVDSLPFNNDKDLFKHIACFFVGLDKDVTETILNACDLKTKSGITHLLERCLLRIGWDNKLMMHQLVQEIGKDLVRQESPDNPCERSRLWCHGESFNVLEQENGTGKNIGLALDVRMLEKEKFSGSLQLKTKALSKMENLKLLQLNYVKLSGSYKNISKQLRWLCMHGFSLESIPSELPMENLVVLDMSYSNIHIFDMSYSTSQRILNTLKGLSRSSSPEKRLLGKLKILDLSFCKQLRRVGGFFELPALERLVVRGCISLIEVCESIGHCVKLVHIDFSYCHKLRKLPISIGKLEYVKTLLLDGCNSRESRIKSIPSDLKIIMPSLRASLRILSLANNNLTTESFPKDLTSLSMLEELCLDFNPIDSMPKCVRSLPRLQKLTMRFCSKLISIEHPPRTLKVLSVFTRRKNYKKILLSQVKFDPEMSPLTLYYNWQSSLDSLSEVDGMVKIQPMADVEEKVLNSLGWTNIESIKERRLSINDIYGGSYKLNQTKMYYEFGIFSTIYEGEGMPKWVECRSTGSSISFTIPSSPKKLIGLNFVCVEKWKYDNIWLPMIKISNITKDHTWIYRHCIHTKGLERKGDLTLLTHWMFGPNEMKGGDQITITVAHKKAVEYNFSIECGIGLVYDDEDGKIKEEEDVLGYYKSWNHIIGGDLSAFQLITGEYILDNEGFMRYTRKMFSPNHPFINYGSSYKEEEVRFKAFSQKKDDIHGSASQTVPYGRMNRYQPGVTSSLANASQKEQRTMLRENLYPLVEQHETLLSAEVTGMLLKLDLTEVLHLLESPEALKAKVAHAMSDLRHAMRLHVASVTSAIANASPTEQRTILGKSLYPLVEQLEAKLAPKITGMLLELETTEVLHFLESPEALKARVAEAMWVLRNEKLVHDAGINSALANASEMERKTILGVNLYPLVKQLEPESAAMVTEILLEMYTTEVLHLLESPEALKAKVAEAIEFLKNAKHLPVAYAPSTERRTILGKSLYPLVEQLEAKSAPKVTGMLLEMETTEVIDLLESPEALKAKVAEAMEVLKRVSQQDN